MIDQFAKTLVIDDPDYAPGAIMPLQSNVPNQASNGNQALPNEPADNTSGDDAELPEFDDTSWLT
ncbi:MAG: hypothetical protein AB8G16_10350 [Gammaproteobacteria bacterium]